MGKTYGMDMSKEREKPALLPKGWREFEISACVEEVSKAGNTMFKITIIDLETKSEEDIYAVATEGKRWYLKQLLSACGIEAGEDGVYAWDIADIISKIALGRVEHFDDEWINRENQKVITTKHKIAQWDAVDESKPKSGSVPF